MRNAFTWLSLRCERQCYLWGHWWLLKDWNSEQMVGCLIEKLVHHLTRSSQLIQLLYSLMTTFWMKQTPCWIPRQVQAATLMMKTMGQECQLRNPEDRVRLACQPGKKQKDYNSVIPQDDQICIQDQTYKLHVGYNECKLVPPDHQTNIRRQTVKDLKSSQNISSKKHFN